jgi:hypothetical protein
MTLKIEQLSGEHGTRIRLSGELRSDHIDQVKAEIERNGSTSLDLEEVDLVGVEGIRFLNTCKAEGIPLLYCSPYIQEWMLREQGRSKAPTKKRKKGQGSLGE